MSTLRTYTRMFLMTLLCLLFSSAAQAEDKSGVSVGVKMWVNDWSHDDPLAGSITSDYAVLIGPAIDAKFGENFFAEASYLFPASSYSFSYPNSASIDREDLDFSIGYLIAPGFGLLAGYKNSTFKEKTSGTKDTLSGPIAGIRGIAPVDRNISFYLDLDYLFTRFKQEDALGTFEEDSPGWIFDVGVKIAFDRNITGKIGYKYETNKGNSSDIRDSFSGFTLGTMFAF